MKKRYAIQKNLSIFFGVVTASGGAIGYMKAASAPSLIMGLSFGLLFILSGLLGKKLPKQTGLLNLYASVALTAFFTFRFVTAWKFMPSGLMATLSILMFVWSFYFLKKLKNRPATSV